MSVAEKLSEYVVNKQVDFDAFMRELGTFIETPCSILRIRELILELAVRGKLAEQSRDDEPARELLHRVEKEKSDLIANGNMKRQSVKPTSTKHARSLLPFGWERCRLGQCIFLISGQHLKPSEYNETADGFPYLTGPADFGPLYPTAKRWTHQERSLAKRDDILVTVKGAGIGKTNLLDSPVAFISRQLMAVRPICVDREFIRLLLNNTYQTFQDLGVGIAIPGIGRSDILDHVIGLPPLAEQHRIVAKVDSLMGLCDRLESQRRETLSLTDQSRRSVLASLTSSRDASELASSWRRLSDHFEILHDRPETLADLRQTILALAVQGKLVRQDPNDEPASALFSKITQTKSSLVEAGKIKPPKCPRPNVDTLPFGVPASWVWVKLGAIAHTIESGWSPKCESHPREGEDWGVLKISAVTWGKFQPDENKALPSGVEPRPHCEVQRGDFLMSRANTAELVAKSVVVRETPPRLMMNDKLLRIVFSPNISLDYVNLVNNSTPSRTYYESVASGTSVSMRNVSRENVTNLPIPFPPLAEQNRIVAKVDRLLAQCDRVAESLTLQQATTAQLLAASIARLLAARSDD